MADVLIDKFRVKVVRQGTTPANPGNVTTDPLEPVNPPGQSNQTLYKLLGDTTDRDFIGKNGFVPVVVGESLLTLQPLPNATQDGLISGGIVQWTGTGYVFNVSSALARFEGLLLSSSPDIITLTTADPTNPRIDLFILQILFDGNGIPNGMETDFITGTPAATPVKPQINPATQIELTQVSVPALSTTPTLTTEVIYDENTEWTGSSSGTGTVNFNSTTAPYQGIKSIETTNVQTNNKVILSDGADYDLAGVQTLGFQIRLKATLGATQNIGISFLNSSGTQVTNELIMNLDKSISGAYQFVGIALSSFVFSSPTKNVRSIQFRFIRASGSVTFAGYFLDIIKLEGGINPPVQFGTFLSLQDTPSSYSGQAGKVVAVKSDESGLEFITVGGGGITGSGTANEIAYFTGASAIASLPVATYPSLTELAYLKGVTSAIQTQINSKLSDAPSDGSHYARKDASWVAFTPGIQHATSDGNWYASRNGAWASFVPFTVAGTATNGHVITSVSGTPTWAAPSGGGGNFIAYDVAQSLTGTQRQQALHNIGSTAGSVETFTNSGTVTVNNLAITKSNIVFDGTATVTLTGIVPLWDGQEVTIYNKTNSRLSIAQNSGLSTPGNRFSGIITIGVNQFVKIKYIENSNGNKYWQFVSPSWETALFGGNGGFISYNPVSIGIAPSTINTALTLSPLATGLTQPALVVRNFANSVDLFRINETGFFAQLGQVGGGTSSIVSFALDARPVNNISSYVWRNNSTVLQGSFNADGSISSMQGLFLGTPAYTTALPGSTRANIRGVGTTTGQTLLLEDSAGTDNAIFLDNGQIRFLRLPVASAGLAAGSLWNDAGTIKIV